MPNGMSDLSLRRPWSGEEAAPLGLCRQAAPLTFDAFNMTPMHRAVLHGHDEVVGYLLDQMQGTNALGCQRAAKLRAFSGEAKATREPLGALVGMGPVHEVRTFLSPQTQWTLRFVCRDPRGSEPPRRERELFMLPELHKED